jgi:hypothetical protein
MSDVPTIRREGAHHPFASLAIAVLTSSAACAGLLDLPSDPYVGESDAAVAGTEGPAREPDAELVGMEEGPEANSDSPADAGSSPPRGTGGMAANAGVTPPAGTVVPTPGPSSAPSDPEPASNAAEDAIEEPAPEPSIADAGNDEVVPVPDDPPPPEPPLVACADGETLGPRGTCYFAVGRRMSWGNARENCRARGRGWDLGSIRSAADNRVVGEIIRDPVWLGASDGGSEGVWSWVIDDRSFWRGTERGSRINQAFEAWNSDEPNGGATSDCARAVPRDPPRADGPTWADFECEEQLGSLCEGPTQ